MKNKVYDVVVDRMIEAIEGGALPPWVKPWNSVAGGTPMNLISKKPYRGFNSLLLSVCGSMFSSPYFLTYKQADALGGKVRKGEHSLPVVFWTFLEDKDDDGNVILNSKGQPKKHVLTRYYNVFNTDQVDGIEDKIPTVEKPETTDFHPDNKADEIIKNYQLQEVDSDLTIAYRGDQAFYQPTTDSITVPKPEDFTGSVNFYATLFHEMGHSTGHASRLARKGIVNNDEFGSDLYAKEELIAELTASFLCGVAGFEEAIEKNSASYLKSWLKVIKESPNMLVESAQGAQKAADYILNEERS
jgi:antirestriction protein ArdC